MSAKRQLPFLGFGLGLRKNHYQEIMQTKPQVDWFEIITENYLTIGGKPLYYLDVIRQDYPMVMHGVSLSIGSCDPLSKLYLEQVKQLANRVQPEWISDHLCWNGVQQQNSHDLWPLPYTEEAICHVSDKIKQAQDILQRQILLENISSYINYQTSEMPEWEFLTQVVTRADCFILLDINNVFVNSYNHQFDPIHYLQQIPKNRVHQYHLAGHSQTYDCIIDTHDQTITHSVWDLYQTACSLFGAVSTCIERDDQIPPLDDLLQELQYAQTLYKRLIE